jgi:hypothetical protein
MGHTRKYLRAGVGAVAGFAAVIAMVPGPSAAQITPPPVTPARTVPGAPAPLTITTEGGVPITSRDDYVNGSMLLDGVQRAIEIRGRGNSTWTWPKKPYKIKLAEDAALLGTEPRDEWVLLANYADRTAMRTWLAMSLGASTRLAFTPRTRFVDVVLNGIPIGLYLLTDQVEQGTERVELPDKGFLLEVNKRFREQGDRGFWSDHRMPVSFKDPDEPNRTQRQNVRGAVNRFERALYGKDFTDPEAGYASHIDVESFIDWYLVEELFFNQDSYFATSVHFTWSPGGDIAMGPLWDFDLSAGTKWNGMSPPGGYYTRSHGEHWINRMFDDPAFTRAVKARWAQLRPVVDAMIAEIPAAADVIRPSALSNWAIWPQTTESELKGSVHADTFDGEVSYLANWLTARAAWMSADEVIFDMPSAKVRERPHVINVPVRILGDQTRPATVAYALTSSTATLGKDFTVTAGELTFGPGETVKTFPVRILADRKPERRETINLELVAASGVRLDNPSTVRITIKKNDQRVR